VALIRRFIQGEQRVRRHPTRVDCYFQVLDDGSRLLHLTTFGSNERSSEPKSSQSIQLDEDRARELIAILKDAFPTLRNT
jgi:hypothetical protein